MEGNLVLDAKTLSKSTGLPIDKISKRLKELKNCQLLTVIQDDKIIVLLPDADSPAIQEANEMFEKFMESVGRRKE